MPPAPIDPGHNLHSLYCHGQPFGIECQACGRRGTAFTKERVATFRADMRRLSTLAFVCSKCGSREWRGWLLHNDAEAEAWRERPFGGPSF